MFYLQPPRHISTLPIVPCRLPGPSIPMSEVPRLRPKSRGGAARRVVPTGEINRACNLHSIEHLSGIEDECTWHTVISASIPLGIATENRPDEL
jgi:hypothetical protein